MASFITVSEAQPGDIVLDEHAEAWHRGAEFYSWATFDGLVTFFGEWKDEYGPQGRLDLLVRNGHPV